jgi:hypothetical protein
VIDWGFLEQTFGQPPLPPRLMWGWRSSSTPMTSDEALCDCWEENPDFQHFCGKAFFQCVGVPPFVADALGGQRMGQEKLRRCCRRDAMMPSDLAAL